MAQIFPPSAITASSSSTPPRSVGAAEHQEAIDTATMHPTIPLVLSFDNLTYSVKPHLSLKWFNPIPGKDSETKVLLNDISGEAHDGEILAVLGPSGSGKSTLIDALANRIVKGSLKGTINLNGKKLDSSLLKVISAYVMQDDLLFPMLTVEETLMFAAELRLPRTVSKSKKKKRVRDLIDQLDLRNAMNTVIGDEGHRGISGGERRRVSIGIDIIHDPILLFLDEPTSGLDSGSAFMVVKVLQRIAQTGSTVIMSIHQPSYRILRLLNRLIFLSHGEIVYSGSPSNLSNYLADFGHPIPEDENPSEAALDLISDLENTLNGTKCMVQFNKSKQITNTTLTQNPSPRQSTNTTPIQNPHPKHSSSRQSTNTTFIQIPSPCQSTNITLTQRQCLRHFLSEQSTNTTPIQYPSPIFTQNPSPCQNTNTTPSQYPSPMLHWSLNQAIVSSISRGKLVFGADSNTTEVPTFTNPFWAEVLVLSKRSFLNSRRMPELFATRFGATLITAIMLATLFINMDISPVGNAERIRFVGFTVATISFVCTDGIPNFLYERSIFLRETAFNSYRKISYCLSHALVWIPSLFSLSLTLAAITFWGTNVNGGGILNFFFYLGIIMASFWAGNSFVTMVTEIIPHVMLGYVIVVATLSYYFLFCGLFITRDRIPSYWLWFHYLSPKKYANAAILHNAYGDSDKCFVRGIQFFDGTPLNSVSIGLKEQLLQNIGKTLGRNITGSTCIMSGEDILKGRGVTDLSKWDCFWITVAWGFLFRILFYFALLVGIKNKRK